MKKMGKKKLIIPAVLQEMPIILKLWVLKSLRVKISRVIQRLTKENVW